LGWISSQISEGVEKGDREKALDETHINNYLAKV
jgi:hypothetical protein